MHTKTGRFPIGFRRGWTDWFNDTSGLINWAKSNNFGVIDAGSDLQELSNIANNEISIGSADLKDWHGLISANPADRKASLTANAEFIPLAAELGVKNYFAVMLPKDPHAKRSENFAYMVDSLNKLSDVLSANGGRLVIEGWPGEGALCCTPESYEACLAQTPASIGINFDPSHLIRMGIDPHRFLKDNASRVYHVHGKDCYVNQEALYQLGHEQPATWAKNHDFGNAVWRYTIPGYGQSDWKQIFSILNENGYQGAVSIELEDENFNGSTEGEQAGLKLAAQVLAAM
jgi:sugar phosphate isomerase/epimerase